MKNKFIYLFIKRLLDIVFSIILILILSPVMILVYILIYYKLGSPVIFKQRRPGLNSNIFTMYKFRTMRNSYDSNGNLLSDKDRLTKFGLLLRETSIDELPELYNVLIGNMSFVGPRPQLIRDLVFMNEYQLKRHNAKPGITGLAQINGRNNISWEKKFVLDIEYEKNRSLRLDILIILKTIEKVIKRENINTEGMATSQDYGDYLLENEKISKELYEEKLNLAQKMEFNNE